MPLDCLSGLVVVKGCGSNPASSFIQQLPGISIPEIDVAINTDHVNAKAFLEQQIDSAIEYVIQDVNQNLSLKHDLKTFIENDSVGVWQEDKEIDAAEAGYLVGLRIKIDYTPYLKLFLNRIKLFVNNTGTVPVYIYDLIQGKLLDTINVDTVAGEVVVAEINKEYYTQKQRLHLFIGYESSFDSYKTNLSNADDCGNCMYSNSYITFQTSKILTGAAKILDNIETNTRTAGISLTYSLSCSFEEYLCSIRNLLALPVKYKAGAMIMQQLKLSKRPNPLVTAYKGDNEAMEAFYEAEYSKQMKNIFKNMRMPKSICFECNPQTKSVVVLP